jgi:hypothetical protein
MFGLANDLHRCCINLIVRRPAWLRLFIGLWGLWFNAALLEAPGVHACAVHSNVATAGHHHGSVEMPMPMPSHSGHEQASSSHSPNDSAPQCSCLSACCGVAAFVVGRAPAAPSASYSVSSPARIGVVAGAPTIERPHERPFANGPPSLI